MRLTRTESRAVLLVFVALLALMGGVLLDRWLFHPLPAPLVLDEIVMDSLNGAWSGGESDSEKAVSHRSAGAAASYAVPIQRPETFSFDPNTADSTTFLRLGLAPWQVRNIYKYRARGGRYHRPEDFKRVYGMTPELWERLAPVIRIDPKYRYFTAEDLRPDTAAHRKAAVPHDTIHQPAKFTTLTPVDLNTADTTLLKCIPGIASYRARQIVRYRERLGGFVSLEQLSEIEALTQYPDVLPSLLPWLRLETGVYRKMNVNKLSLTQLGRHPYIGFARARAIDNYRQLHGKIQSLRDLCLLPEFPEDAIQRLMPYVEF